MLSSVGHARGDLAAARAAPPSAAGGQRSRRARARARELPAHRAVLQRDDRVRQPHAAQRLGADVGAGAAAAVHDDRASGAGTSSAMRSTSSPPGMLYAPGMQPREYSSGVRVSTITMSLAAIDPRGQLEATHFGRLEVVQRPLAEDLARHVEALTTVRRRRARPRGRRRARGRRCSPSRPGVRGQRGERSVVVVQHAAWRRRHERGQPRSRSGGARGGAEDVAALVGGALAHVEHGVRGWSSGASRAARGRSRRSHLSGR